MKLGKFVKFVAPASIICGLTLLIVSIVSIALKVHVSPNPAQNDYYYSKWLTCESFGVAIGFIQVTVSGLMYRFDTGHTALTTPFIFLGGSLLLFLGTLALFAVSIAFKMDRLTKGVAFVAILGVDFAFVLGTMACLIYLMTKSKVIRVFGRRAAAAAVSS